MKSKSIQISVVIPRSQEGVLTAEWAAKELAGINHEIIVSKTWADGAKKATGDFVCFLEKDCVLGKGYFKQLLEGFEDKPSFRKLAMIAPAIGVNSYENIVYGMRIARTDVYPAYIPSSSSSYLVQIAYIPGSLIRRSSLSSLSPVKSVTMLDSINFSLSLWGSGQRILLNPRSLYVSTNLFLDEPYGFDPNNNSIENRMEVADLFRREEIG